MTHPNNHDPHFLGWGLDTPYIEPETFLRLFIERPLQEIRRKIIQRVGVWKLRCPSFRIESESELWKLDYSSNPIPWHPYTSHSDRIIANQDNSVGKMHFTPQEELLKMAITSEVIPERTRKKVEEVLQERKSYSREASALVHTFFSRVQAHGLFDASPEEFVVDFSHQDDSRTIVMFDCDTIVMRISDQLSGVIGKTIRHDGK